MLLNIEQGLVTGPSLRAMQCHWEWHQHGSAAKAPDIICVTIDGYSSFTPGLIMIVLRGRMAA